MQRTGIVCGRFRQVVQIWRRSSAGSKGKRWNLGVEAVMVDMKEGATERLAKGRDDWSIEYTLHCWWWGLIFR